MQRELTSVPVAETLITHHDITEIVKVLADHPTIIRNWEELWIELGSHVGQVEELKQAPLFSSMKKVEILYHIVSSWKSKFSDSATIEHLVLVLRRKDHNEAADHICKIYQINSNKQVEKNNSKNHQSSSLKLLPVSTESDGDRDLIRNKNQNARVPVKCEFILIVVLCLALSLIIFVFAAHYIVEHLVTRPNFKDVKSLPNHVSNTQPLLPVVGSTKPGIKNANVLCQAHEFKKYRDLNANLKSSKHLNDITLKIEILAVRSWLLKYDANNLTIKGHFSIDQLLETLNIFSTAATSIWLQKLPPTYCPVSFNLQHAETLQLPSLKSLTITNSCPCEESFMLVRNGISAPKLTHMRLLSGKAAELSNFIKMCVHDEDSFLTTNFCTRFPNLQYFENDMIWIKNQVLRDTGCSKLTHLKSPILVSDTHLIHNVQTRNSLPLLKKIDVTIASYQCPDDFEIINTLVLKTLNKNLTCTIVRNICAYE